MNPLDQPTPRTQAVWKTHCGFSNEDEATEAVCDFRDLSNTLERELAAAKAECERSKFALVEWEAKERGWSKAVEKDAAELTRLRALFPAILAALRNGGCCTTDVSVEFLECVPNEVASVVSRLRAEVERLKGALALGQQNCDDAYDDLREERDEAIARAEKAEDIIRSLCRISNIPIGSDAATNPAMKGTP
jgi:hypothetical protein